MSTKQIVSIAARTLVVLSNCTAPEHFFALGAQSGDTCKCGRDRLRPQTNRQRAFPGEAVSDIPSEIFERDPYYDDLEALIAAADFLAASRVSAPRTPSEKRELLCEICNRDYKVWFAPNALWNEVVRDQFNFLCPTCFTNMAAAHGVEYTAFEVRVESNSEAGRAPMDEELAKPVAFQTAVFDKSGMRYTALFSSARRARKYATDLASELGVEEWRVISLFEWPDFASRRQTAGREDTRP